MERKEGKVTEMPHSGKDDQKGVWEGFALQKQAQAVLNPFPFAELLLILPNFPETPSCCRWR